MRYDGSISRRDTIPDLDIGVIYTHERNLIGPLLSTLSRSGDGIRARLLLVDNRSADGVQAWRRLVPDTVVLRNARRLGYAANLNRILEASTARHILLLNTDMVFAPEAQCLTRMVGFMDARPDCGISSCAIYHADGGFAYPARRFQTLPILAARRLGLGRLLHDTLDRYLYRDRPIESTFPCDWLSGCFLMLRREAFGDIGFFDEGFVKYFEDVDICYRAARSGWQVFYHGATCCYHLEQRASRRVLSLDAMRHAQSYLRWYWKWGVSYRRDMPAPAAPRRAA
jgi:N-acetylglucosaminyl-diphospho-decaprenol L-rhamnosyltransferase